MTAKQDLIIYVRSILYRQPLCPLYFSKRSNASVIGQPASSYQPTDRLVFVNLLPTFDL